MLPPSLPFCMTTSPSVQICPKNPCFQGVFHPFTLLWVLPFCAPEFLDSFFLSATKASLSPARRSPGEAVLCPAEGGWEHRREDVPAQTPVCASLISLTYHFHLAKDVSSDWNEILFILGADKYIFDIFILSDNSDHTRTTRITALVSAALISAAQGKIANIKWSWH